MFVSERLRMTPKHEIRPTSNQKPIKAPVGGLWRWKPYVLGLVEQSKNGVSTSLSSKAHRRHANSIRTQGVDYIAQFEMVHLSFSLDAAQHASFLDI